MNVEQSLKSLYKLHERLTIILDHNIAARIDMSEEDASLIKELTEWMDRSSLSWVNTEEPTRQIVTQKPMFK